MQYIETTVQGGTLVLRFSDEAEHKDIQPTTRIKFNVDIKEIEGLRIGGVGDIHAPSLAAKSLELVIGGVGDVNVSSVTVDDLYVNIGGAGDVNINSLKAKDLEFVLDGAADINVDELYADKLVETLNGAGDVVLAGRVVEQSIFLNGAVNHWAAGLESQTTFVEAGGAGNVIVWVTDSLDVYIGGPSTVSYHGNPQVTQDVSRVGRLIRLDDSELPQAPAATPAAYWPTSTPSEQGLDAGLLAAMVEAIEDEDYDVDSVTVIRHGHKVLDEYFSPFEPSSKHIIHSCTKSIVSALIGIAIDQGYIEGVDQPVLDIFPGYTADNLDADKQAMTLEDMLTMSSGLECRDSYLYDWRGLGEMRDSDDWVQFMLDLPMAEAPGTRFEYCNGGSFLLAAIVQEATGVSALEFAQEHLFGPLGITDVHWPTNPAGINIGWGEMHLQPHDMAKIGYLYLNGGQWEGEQIVPAAWVQASIQAHINAATLFDDYGYQWWVDDDGYYMAVGYAGQFIYVLPDEDMVVVFTSDLEESDFYVPYMLLNEYIIPAATGA
jgi:CubicO group peptidase (beta-lactamase class C family)